jgi:hypothetical protein
MFAIRTRGGTATDSFSARLEDNLRLSSLSLAILRKVKL